MSTDYDHCMLLLREVMPEAEWRALMDEWPHWACLDHGDNEPFLAMRNAMIRLIGQRDAWKDAAEMGQRLINKSASTTTWERESFTQMIGKAKRS